MGAPSRLCVTLVRNERSRPLLPLIALADLRPNTEHGARRCSRRGCDLTYLVPQETLERLRTWERRHPAGAPSPTPDQVRLDGLLVVVIAAVVVAVVAV